MRIDLTSWLAADLLGCVVWLALAVALEAVAAPSLGVAPGLLSTGVVASGGLVTLMAVGRLGPPMSVALDERRIVAIVPANGRPAPLAHTAGSRVTGGTVLLAGQVNGGRIRLWITPFDASRGSLRRLALALRHRAGPLEA